MEYKEFEVDFINRSLEIIAQYDAHVIPHVGLDRQFEVTLLINCLLGLLVLPKERRRRNIPDTPIRNLTDWGIKESQITKAGKDCVGRTRTPDNLTLLELVSDLRHSVAHILFRTFGNGEQITHLNFRTNRSGIQVEMPIEDFKQFVTKFAKSVTSVATPGQG